NAIEQLAAAATAADEREGQLQLRSQRLLEALDALRGHAAELVSGADETDSTHSEPESKAIDYSLFVPGPNGYELVPQTGVPPQAGQRVELVLSDEAEPVLYEVARSGRTLPGGDVCVYLAQV